MDLNVPVMSPFFFEVQSLHAGGKPECLFLIYIYMVNIGTSLSDLCILYVREPVMFTLHGAIFKCFPWFSEGLVIINAKVVLQIWQPPSCNFFTETNLNESVF